MANRKRDYFVSREEAQKVLDACPGCRVAAAVLPEPIRRLAVSIGTLGAPMDGRGPGFWPHHGVEPKD